MPQDIVKLLEEYVADDPYKWSKLASDIQFRRLHLLLLREILLEVREVHRALLEDQATKG